MFDEKQFEEVHNLLLRYLKRDYEVEHKESVIIALSRSKQFWHAAGLFDQRLNGMVACITYAADHPDIERDGPWNLEGCGETPELALKDLKTRINRLLKK